MATFDPETRDARAHVELVDGLHFSALFPAVPDAAPLDIDEPRPVGGGEGPNPAALLAAAVGGCLAASLTLCLRKARIDPEGVSADAVAHVTRNEAGRFRVGGIEVELSVDVANADEGRLARCKALFEDFCIVTESVRHGIPVAVALKTTEADLATAQPH